MLRGGRIDLASKPPQWGVNVAQLLRDSPGGSLLDGSNVTLSAGADSLNASLSNSCSTVGLNVEEQLPALRGEANILIFFWPIKTYRAGCCFPFLLCFCFCFLFFPCKENKQKASLRLLGKTLLASSRRRREHNEHEKEAKGRKRLFCISVETPVPKTWSYFSVALVIRHVETRPGSGVSNNPRRKTDAKNSTLR